MFEFLGIVFNKIVSIVATAMIALGLGSAQPIVIEPGSGVTDTPAVVEELEQDEEQLAEDEPKLVPVAQISEVFSPPAPAPEPVPEPVLSPPPPPLPPASESLPPPSPPAEPKTFTTPSGVVVDEYGNVIAPPAPEPATQTPASSGSSLPSGWSQLPSGKFIDPYGTIYDKMPESVVEPVTGTIILPEGWTQMMSGAFKDPDGRIYTILPADVPVTIIPILQPKAPKLPAGWTQMMSGAFKDPNGKIYTTLPDNIQ